MTASLADALAVIRPALSPRLVPDPAFARLNALARSLGPVYWGGFECDLTAGGERIDLHQGLFSPGDGPAVTGAPITRLQPAAHGFWERFERLLRTWAEPSSPLHHTIAQIGLEFDLAGPPAEPPAPAVFWSFRDADRLSGIQEALFTATPEIWEMLRGIPPAPATLDTLRTCREHLPAGAAVLHAGTRTAGEGSVLRVNVWGLTLDQTMRFLQACGGAALPPDLHALLVPLEELLDNMVLALDVGPGAVSVNGLECLPRRRADGALDWPFLLDRLIGLGLCDESRREGLLAWPGRVDAATARAAWPTDLMIASLLRGPQWFSSFHRRLNHIKISKPPEGPIGGKAYLEFYHRWESCSGGSSGG